MEKKNVVFLTVLAIATLLTAVVGTTFAYFTATVTNKTTPTSTTVTTANAVSVEYDDGAQINLTNAVPGAYATKTFKVTNKGTDEVTYSISIEGVTNSFETNGSCSVATATTQSACSQASGTWTEYNDFVYSLTKNGTQVYTTKAVNTRVYPETISDSRAYSKTNGKAQVGTGSEAFVRAMQTARGTLIDNTDLAGLGTDTYVLTVYFIETGINQNENANGKTFAGTLKTNLVTAEGVQVETVNAP